MIFSVVDLLMFSHFLQVVLMTSLPVITLLFLLRFKSVLLHSSLNQVCKWCEIIHFSFDLFLKTICVNESLLNICLFE